jgi:hypothetical protein
MLLGSSEDFLIFAELFEWNVHIVDYFAVLIKLQCKVDCFIVNSMDLIPNLP